MQSIVADAATVVAKQAVIAKESEKLVQSLLGLISAARSRLNSGDGKAEDVLVAVKQQLGPFLKNANAQTKDLHAAVGKLGKVFAFQRRAL